MSASLGASLTSRLSAIHPCCRPVPSPPPYRLFPPPEMQYRPPLGPTQTLPPLQGHAPSVVPRSCRPAGMPARLLRRPRRDDLLRDRLAASPSSSTPMPTTATAMSDSMNFLRDTCMAGMSPPSSLMIGHAGDDVGDYRVRNGFNLPLTDRHPASPWTEATKDRGQNSS